MLYYIGTYTNLGGPGVAVVDVCADQISILSTEGSLKDPSYVILSKDKTRLYAVCGGESPGDDGYAATYAVDGASLTLLNKAALNASGPCHLCLSADEKYLYTANYMSGSLSVIKLTDGSLVQVIQHTGSGPNADRQEAAHMHQVGFIPGTNILWAVDLGTDSVFTYRQDAATGVLSDAESLKVPGGLGPRHLAFAQNGRDVYLAQEMGNELSHIRWNGTSLEWVASYPSLPADYKNESTTAAVRLSPNGKKVYISNRGHDSLAAFAVSADGSLAAVGHIDSFGNTPRDFQIIADDRALIANQDSGTVAVIDISGREGVLLSECVIPGAVCICA